jgi:DNA-binding GntR family transcriptional regulator
VTIGREHRTLREVVADEIRSMITTGQLSPGERLYEENLAEQLGVSRNPVREAIRALEATGLVEVLPRRGAYVSKLDYEQAMQLMELRSVIEAYAAELAAKRRTDEHIARLREIINTGRDAWQRNDLVKAAEAHRDFYIGIEEASGNQYLKTVVGPLRHQTELVFSLLADVRGVLGWAEHEKILEAIVNGDVATARDVTIGHMSSVIRDLSLRAKSESSST